MRLTTALDRLLGRDRRPPTPPATEDAARDYYDEIRLARIERERALDAAVLDLLDPQFDPSDEEAFAQAEEQAAAAHDYFTKWVSDRQKGVA